MARPSNTGTSQPSRERAHHATQAFSLLTSATAALFVVLCGLALTKQCDGLLAQPNFTAVKRYALARLAHIAPTCGLVMLLTLTYQLGTDVVVSRGGDKHAAGKTGGFIAKPLTLPALAAPTSIRAGLGVGAAMLAAQIIT